MKQRSSILTELGWLAFFLVVFAIYMEVLSMTLVRQQHFNDVVADLLAGIFAALTMIAVRARMTRNARKP